MSLPIAIQVYSIRDYAVADFKEAMLQIKHMGYDGVELAGLYGHTAAEIKKILDEAGLELVSAHVPVDELKKDEVLDDYVSTGIKYIAIPWMSVENTEESVNAALATIKSIAQQCKQRNLQLMYHNHDFEFKKLNGKSILDTFYSEIPADLLQTELDTCWVNVGGENPSEYILKYSGRAPIVHLKDFVGTKSENMYALVGNDEKKQEATEAFQLRPVGYGVQDVKSIINAAEDAGAKWLIVEQDEPSMGKTPMECARMSIDYLKTIL